MSDEGSCHRLWSQCGPRLLFSNHVGVTKLSGVFVYLREDKLRRTFYHLFRIVSLSKACYQGLSLFEKSQAAELLTATNLPEEDAQFQSAMQTIR